MASASQKFSFKKLFGNFIKALFIALIGGGVSAAVLILGNSAENSVEIFTHIFWPVAAVSTAFSYAGTYFIMAMGDTDRSEKANRGHITFWSIICLITFGLMSYGFYDYYYSKYRAGSGWNIGREKIGKNGDICDPKHCLEFR